MNAVVGTWASSADPERRTECVHQLAARFIHIEALRRAFVLSTTRWRLSRGTQLRAVWIDVRPPSDMPDVLAFAGTAARLHLLVHHRVHAHERLIEYPNCELFTGR